MKTTSSYSSLAFAAFFKGKTRSALFGARWRGALSGGRRVGERWAVGGPPELRICKWYTFCQSIKTMFWQGDKKYMTHAPRRYERRSRRGCTDADGDGNAYALFIQRQWRQADQDVPRRSSNAEFLLIVCLGFGLDQTRGNNALPAPEALSPREGARPKWSSL